jgi:hypothetical protein
MTNRNTTLKTVPVTALVPSGLTQLDNQLAALMPRLAQLDDAQLLNLALQAQRLESCAFRLRGACVAELPTNHPARRRSGQRDAAGVGIKARLAHLATQLGVSVSTLKTNAHS